MRRVLRSVAQAVIPESFQVARDVANYYRGHIGVRVKLTTPKTFDEKILYRMVLDRRPLLPVFSDKFAAREYVRARLGAHILPKVYLVTKNPTEIEFAGLPERFVVKPNHGSGWHYFVRDKTLVNRDDVVRTCEFWLKQNYYYACREWVYKHIEPRILVEEYIDDGTGSVPTDYKFLVFGGRVQVIHVDVDRFVVHRRNYYDRSWQKFDVTLARHHPIEGNVPRPKHLDEMIEYAEALGADVEFLRVDLYDTSDKVYFGELTVAPANGLNALPMDFDLYLGKLWKLPRFQILMSLISDWRRRPEYASVFLGLSP